MFQRWFQRVSSKIPGPHPISDTIDAAIRLQNIVKEFKTPAGSFTALKGINLNLYSGQFVAVTGKSGSGKSTLVNMITGIDRPTRGEVMIGNTAIHHLSESRMSIWRGTNLGIIFQFYQLLPMLSLVENVMLPMDIAQKYASDKRERRALELLDLVGLADQAHKMPAAVSGGQQQAAAIARSLANDPPYIIADEPTGNLDSKTAENIFQLFEQLSSQGKTIIMITHDPALASRIPRQVLIVDGEVINETIHQTFPMLSHAQLLHVTQHTKAELFSAGKEIQTNSKVHILKHGEVEIHPTDPQESFSTGNLKTNTLLIDPGHFKGAPAAFTFRAVSPQVETAAIDYEVVRQLMNQSSSVRKHIENTLQHFHGENQL